MVAQLLRLRLSIYANLVKRGGTQVIWMLVGGGLGVAIIWLTSFGLVALRVAPTEFARDILVIGGSFVVLGFTLLPVVFGVDDALDPRKFVLFGVPNRVLSLGLYAAALIGVPSIVIAVLSSFTVVTWTRDGFTLVMAILSALIAVLTCVLVARVMTSVATLLLASRRSREFSAIVGLVLVVLVAPAAIFLSSVDWSSGGGPVLSNAADVVSWTPFGAVWAVPGDIALGAASTGFLKLVIALATLGLLWLAWSALVARMQVTADRPPAVRTYSGLGWFDLMPARPGAVIAARSITYWGRDPRYLVSLLVVPILPFIMIVPLIVAGVPAAPLALLPLPIMTVFLGWSLHNDLAHDSSAIWLHVASGVRGAADRLGRTFPVLLVGVPLIIVGSMISIAFFGDWDALPSMLGVTTGLLFTGVGISSYTSARFPYPASAPGDSPFQQPQSSGTTGAVVQSFSFLGSVLLTAPALYFAARGLFEGGDWPLYALLAGVGVGLLVFALGVLAGGRAFNKRGPEIMAFATSV